MKRAQWRLGRYLGLGFFVLVLAPMLVFVAAAFLMNGAYGGFMGFLAFLAVALLALVAAAFPVVLVAVVVGGLGYAILSQYRKIPSSRAASRPAPDGSGNALTVAGAPEVLPISAEVAADIAALETLRAGVARQTAVRSAILVPLVLGSTALFWYATGMGEGGEGSPTLGLIVLLAIAGGFSWILVNNGPRVRYAEAFKRTIMPRLLASYGDLRFAPFAPPPLDRLVALGVLPRHDRAAGDDGIEGLYRGRRVQVGEMDLVRRGDKSDFTVFHGLLVAIDVDPPLPGTTVVLDNTPLAGQVGPERRGLTRVRLEDPVFADIYQVFGSDQIGSRSVLTPAAMERLLAMADGQAFHPPYLLAEGSRMVFAIKRWDNKNLFDPPSLSSHDAAAQFAEGERDLIGVFRLIDAMIEVRDGED